MVTPIQVHEVKRGLQFSEIALAPKDTIIPCELVSLERKVQSVHIS